MAETRNIIWITSYPKSGNTWVTSAVKQASWSHGTPNAETDAYVLHRTGQLPVVNPAVDARFRDRPCSVLKTHSAYSPNGQPHRYPGLTLRTVGYIHIYRNPLDVLLSYISYTRLGYRANAHREEYAENLFRELLGFDRLFSCDEWSQQSVDTIPQSNLDHALDTFSEAGLAIAQMLPMSGSWASHLESWMSVPAGISGHSIRYEDCVADEATFDALADMFVFSPVELREAARAACRKARRIAVAGSQDEVVFYNKMRAYYFVEYFSSAAISRFCNRHEATLRRYYPEILDMA